MFWAGLDLIFPPLCGGCNVPGSRWCEDCQTKSHVLNSTLCDICGLPQNKAGVCDVCRVDRPHFRALRAWCIFDDPIRGALHKLKYRRDSSLGDVLAAAMLPFVYDLHWPVDLIVPIPLGRQRQRERGYNQVGMIARPLALAMDVDYAPGCLVRCRETHSQVGLSRQQRRENVHEAFAASAQVRNRVVLVIDDVSTTGS